VTAPRPVRVYVDGRGVDVPADATAIDAVRAADPALADLVSGGERGIADSRGIVAAPGSPVHGGAIFRIVSGRAQRADDADRLE
jgi:hypothetical protein